MGLGVFGLLLAFSVWRNVRAIWHSNISRVGMPYRRILKDYRDGERVTNTLGFQMFREKWHAQRVKTKNTRFLLLKRYAKGWS
ncbi:hypothetical protein T484DRAFT_2953205 [Baffinella frigidus]|nr:hypothetical protein T484DRAFT_2953205 [Cryptophyta sp. CCMP2293]